MTLRFLAALAATLPALVAAPAAQAAAIAQPLTAQQQSVAGNESQLFSVRFLTAAGTAAVGETVTFSNDACGFFPNGQFNYTTPTDANGVASALFTAMPEGIVCHVVAAAGATASFTVLTYLPRNVSFAVTMDPTAPKPGQSVHLAVTPAVGVYPIYNADVTAAIVPETGQASLAPASGNTGQQGSVGFDATPSGAPGDYQVELRFHDAVQRVPVKLSAVPWQDMWWAGPAENGWGVSVVQHRDTLFSVIYAYDAAGKPTWYVMPGGAWNASHTAYSGPLYRTHGAPWSAYDATRFVVGDPAGDATLDVTDAAAVRLSYRVGGVAGTKALSRQAFGPVDRGASPDTADMWWGGAAQDGWGIAVLQQYRSLFAVWFTYDASGAPTWLVMPSGTWTDAQTWEGRIYRTHGSPWLGAPYDAAALSLSDAGAFRLRVAGDNAAFDYVIDGQSGSVALSRQPF
ncbi:MAG TPA: hypothetical protein VFE23_19400 [Usitatibacter sp.]|jgi:hypothetical protein|nr:hypothetical protein [Usitatibacter sp.]